MELNRIAKYDVEPSMTYAYAYMTLHKYTNIGNGPISRDIGKIGINDGDVDM